MSQDGDFDMDSTVYCTDLMGGCDDLITGWAEGGQQQQGRQQRRAGPTAALGGMLGRIKKKGKNSNNKNSLASRSHAPSATSAAASIALANNNDEDGYDEEDEQQNNMDTIDESTVQTKTTDVFLSYAVDGLDDGMSTVAPIEAANGGQPTDTSRHRQEQQQQQHGGEDTVVDSSLSDSIRSSDICTSTNTSSSPEAISVASSKNTKKNASSPKWVMDNYGDKRSVGGSNGPVTPAVNRSSSKSKSKSTGSDNNNKNKCWTIVALVMLFVGITAVIIGVLYGMGVIALDDTSKGAKGSAEAQACARAGLCGDGSTTSTTNNDNIKQDEEQQEQPIPMDEFDDIPTDRPTAPPVIGDIGICAAHEQKSQSCGALNPDHPSRCCPGLYCDDKYCIDPNPPPPPPVEEVEEPEEVYTTSKPTPPLTEEPTLEPTPPPEPTFEPTTAVPTRPPTPNVWISQPTEELAAQGIVPSPGHFTYDPDDPQYGPSAWVNPQYTATTTISLDGKPLKDAESLGKMDPDDLDGLEVVPADQASAEYKFWSRHAWSIDPNKKAALTENVCDSKAYWGEGNDWRAEQSPIDVYVQSGDIDEDGEETGVPGSLINARCEEHHEIRIKPGQFPLESAKIQKQILPSQLRLLYPDPQFEADGKTLLPDSKLPQADFPHGKICL